MPTTAEILAIRTPKPKTPVINAIAKRFSPRVFISDPIPVEHLETIFEAARWAPSGRNDQPWMFYVFHQGSDSYKKLVTCIPERNGWCLTAPVLIMATYNPIDCKGNSNRWAQYDLGAAVISLTLQAQELGYYSRQIGLFDWEKAGELFDVVQKPWEPFVLIALGKIGTDADYAQTDKETVRRDLQPAVRKESVYIDMP